MTRAPSRSFGRAAVVGCLCGFALGSTPARADNDDWSLTRRVASNSHAATQRAPSVERALARALASPFDPAAIDGLVAAARARDGGLARALEMLEAQSTAAALVVRARLHEVQGESARARELLIQAVELTARTRAPSLPLFRALAQLEQSAGQPEAERAWLERAAQLPQPSAARAALADRLGALTLELGDLAAAREHFDTAARLEPTSLARRFAFARALGAHAKFTEAAVAFGRALEGLGNDRRILPALRIEWAKLQLSAADASGALANLERTEPIVGKGTGLEAELRQLELEAHRRLGTLAEFARELERVRGGDVDALLARVYQELDRPSEA
ncbi:MAG TPA: hypothetical protein VHZ95_07640, partial [Polyangiales bacterium]|nr:hypothetical protein [Polyangiales bacterium]